MLTHRTPGARQGDEPATCAISFLPYEGDSTRSVILGNAFPLADDHAITDPPILSQL